MIFGLLYRPVLVHSLFSMSKCFRGDMLNKVKKKKKKTCSRSVLTLLNPQDFLLFYSYAAVCDFLTNNNLLSVIRAHEAQDAG